jgi:CheY-like chemotaxis protein
MKLRILVVDDEHELASMLKTILEASGNEVTTASSSAAARQVLSGNQFDLVITDMKLERDTAGYEVVQAAKEHPHSPPVLILTAYPVLGRNWRQAGARAMLAKPVNMSVLLETVDHIFAASQKRAGRTILCVDYATAYLKYLQTVLELEGFSVVTSVTAKDSIAIVGSIHVDAAIINYELPDMWGIELVSRLKKIQPRLCVVLLTVEPIRLPADAPVQVVMDKSAGNDAIVAALKGLLADSDTQHHLPKAG